MAQYSPPQRPRALIVEDEIIIALDLEATVHALGFDVCGLAPSASEAKAIGVAAQTDVVLMDVNLEGGREGIEAARWLRAVCGAAVVFVTSHTDGGTVERIQQQVPGAPVLSKPIFQNQLANAILKAGSISLPNSP